MEFSVWAPRAERVELLIHGRRLPMERDADGWHRVETDAEPGDDYAYSLDSGPPRPDPRSRRQPSGVHGPSRVVDLSGFPWTDALWRPPPLASTVLYELHVGTFSPEGTFEGAAARIDHLLQLGVGAVELMPVAAFSGRWGWGYDGVDLFAVHEPYGGPEGLAAFVDACHAAGLAVVIDVVYNHLGPSGNYLGEFGPYFTERHRTPWGAAVNFDDAGSDEVRAFFIDNALMWLRDYHADGLRLDAVHAIYDQSALHFLEDLTAAVRALEVELGRRLWVIAESDLNDPRLVRSPEAGGYGMDGVWSDDFHHALHAALTGERSGYYADFGRLADVAAALQRTYVYDGRHSRFRGRRHGRSAAGVSGHRFLGYLQNHDQVGNRAAGERIGHLAGPKLACVGAALVLTAPFVPMLFMGEEWGATSPFCYFTDHDDPELGRAVSEGRRAEFAAFGWDPASVPDPQDPATFERSKLSWSDLEQPEHRELLQWYRDLIALRAARPELRDGDVGATVVNHDEDRRWVTVRRGRLTVTCNLSGEERGVPVDGAPRLLLASSPGVRVAPPGVVLPPQSAAVLEDA